MHIKSLTLNLNIMALLSKKNEQKELEKMLKSLKEKKENLIDELKDLKLSFDKLYILIIALRDFVSQVKNKL